MSMKNWAKNIEFNPEKVLLPKSLEEMKSIITNAKNNNKKIRVVGSAHSWTNLITTTDILVSLDHWQGLIDVNHKLKQATVKAGTKLSTLGEELFKNNLSMENLGDIDLQSIAGAISTGTHGTGITLQSISNQIVSLKIISANGQLIELSKEINADMFYASLVSLGSFGIIWELTLQCEESYRLKVQQKPINLKECLAILPELILSQRHVEFFFFPMSETCLLKVMNKTQDLVTTTRWSRYINEELLENKAFGLLNFWAFRTKNYQLFSKLMTWALSASTKIDLSHKAFTANRSVLFQEMEYSISFEHFPEVMEEVYAKIKDLEIKTLFPIEIRFVKSDDIWLSPAYKRDSAYFAFHTYNGEDCHQYFLEMEKIMNKYSARPHWGKRHNLSNTDFQKLYPKWEEFKKIRSQLDPDQLFINPYLNSILG
jgi:FAD-linked oxidoreductase